MKPILFLALFVLLFSLLSGCDSDSSTTTKPDAAATATPMPGVAFSKAEAETLLQRLATQDGVKDSTAEMRLSFTDAEGKAQQMDFRLQRRYEGEKVSTLLTVLAPLEESEKALVAFEEAGKPTDALSYLAGLKKVTHLKSDNPLNFRGAKNTVQEMLGMELGKYEVSAVEARNDGEAKAPALVVVLKQKAEASLAYPTIHVILDPADKSLRGFSLLNGKGEVVKRIMVTESATVQGHFTIKKLTITDPNAKIKQQELVTRSMKYDTNLPASLFTEANLIKLVTAASQKAIQ